MPTTDPFHPLDPLTADEVASARALEQTQALLDEMLEANAEHLPLFGAARAV